MPLGDPDPLQRRQKLKGDPYRPLYHYLAPDDWLNDPNGTVFWKGRYHLFYQSAARFPLREPVLANWSHAVSDDLVHWRDLPIALAPEPGTYDALGCWSGTSLVEGDRVIASYHANRGGACLAFSSEDELIHWQKHPGNPLVPFDPAKTYDPCLFKQGDYYYLISGRITGARDGDGRDQQYGGKDVAYLYRSRDMDHWEDRGTFYEGGVFTNPGEDCACPAFFPIGDRFMLAFLSHNQGAQYYLGRFENERFIPETHGRMNFTGPGLYNLGNSGDVTAPIAWVGLTLTGAGDTPLEGATGDCLEIEAVIEPGDAPAVGLKVRCSPDGQEQTVITYDPMAGTLVLDPVQASLNPATSTGQEAQRAPFRLKPGEPLRLRVFVDRSVVEVFANGRQCVAKRIYPTRKDSLGVSLFAQGQAMARSVRGWKMNPVWPV